MYRLQLLAALVLFVVPYVASHGILYSPVPRLGLNRPGTNSKKYTHSSYGVGGDYPLEDSIQYSCGDDSVGKVRGDIVAAFQPGSGVGITWELTLPHDPNGQREYVAIHLRDDSGDWTELYNRDTEEGDIDPSGSATLTAGDTKTASVSFDADLNCDECILLWVWDSETDGGGYIDCADVAVRPLKTIVISVDVVTTGSIPNPNSIEENLSEMIGSFSLTTVSVTVTETSENHYTIDISVTDSIDYPAETLEADFNSYLDDGVLQGNLEAALGTGLTITSVSGSNDDTGNPFLGAASSLHIAAWPFVAVAATLALFRLL